MGHEAWGWVLTSGGHSTHAGAGDEFEIFLVAAGATEEFHGCGLLVVGSDLEGKDINTVEHSLLVDEELLTVPDVVAVFVLDFGMLDTSGVTSSNKVGDASVNTGRSVPEDFGGATVVHRRGPDGEDSVIRVEGSVVEEGLMLSHSEVKRNIIILAPATERMEEEDGVLVAQFDKLFTGILEEENVTIVERVADLEGIDGISLLFLDLLLDLVGGKSVLIESIVELNVFEERHGFSGYEEFTLSEDGGSAGVFLGEGTENTGTDFFLAVLEEGGLVDDSEDLVADSGASDSNSIGAFEFFLLGSSDVLGDGNREEMSLSFSVGQSAHLHNFENFHFVHEALEGEGPALTDGLEVLNLVDIDVNGLEGRVVGGVFLDEGVNNTDLVDGFEDTVVLHVLNDESLGGFLGELTGVDVEFGALGGFIGVGDTSEVLDDTFTSLLVESLNISLFANFEGSGDVAFDEVETSIFVDLSGEISVLGVGGDESDEDDLSGHSEELGDF